MSISVIISNFNGDRFLPKLLESLMNQSGVETEIIVVDRHSSDRSQEILATYPQVTVIQEPPETGLVSGYTAGVKVAKYEHFFFCNEDMWFDPHCLKSLEEQIDLANRIGASDPWQWTYDGTEWVHGGVRFNNCSALAFGSPYPLRVLDFTVKLNTGDRIPLPCAGAFLIHRDVFNELGGWDTSFFLDHEDIDLFIRAWQKNWLCVTVPEAKVYHAVAASSSQQITQVKQTVFQRRYISSSANKLIVALKYFSKPVIPLGLLPWLVTLVKDIIKLRFQRIWWDILALKQVWERLPAAMEFRAKNAELNNQKPGEQFFTETEFAID